MTKKLIYISQEKLSNKVIRDWFIEDFSQQDYQIEFWDITYLIEKNNQPNLAYKDIELIEFNNIIDLENQIKVNKTEKPYYVLIIPYTYEALRIYKLISKHNLFTIFFSWGESPGIFTKKNLVSKIRLFFSLQQSNSKLIKRIIQRQYIKLIRAINFINKYNITFFAGEICRKNTYSLKNVGINLCDYQQYLNVNELRPYENFAVFIDINVPYHQDNPLFNYNIDDEKYYNSLNNFFSIYENKFKTNVVIAAHPKSNYDKDKFNGRPIYKLKTAELIKSCDHVLMHHSTAISYAILSYKPITFFITTEMINTTDHLLSKGLAVYLGNNVINIDKISDDISEKAIMNKALYDKYKYSFIVSKEAEGLNNIDIITKAIQKIA